MTVGIGERSCAAPRLVSTHSLCFGLAIVQRELQRPCHTVLGQRPDGIETEHVAVERESGSAIGLQGAFAALLAPAALSLITVMFTLPKERARAFGVFGAISGGGAAMDLFINAKKQDVPTEPGMGAA